jgi:hypothetical protein
MVCQTFLFRLLMVRNPAPVPGCLLEDAKRELPHMWGTTHLPGATCLASSWQWCWTPCPVLPPGGQHHGKLGSYEVDQGFAEKPQDDIHLSTAPW